MMLSDQVLAGLTKCNFQQPSPIQLRAIPIGRCGLDLILQSKSGTGKTLVFCTIILERYNPEVKAPQSLIVVPTREIALQVESYLNSIGFYCKGFSATCVIGGRDINEDRKRIIKCRAVVGTPGRILHLIKNKFVCLQNIQTLVLDEADKLVTDNFYSDINILLDALNKNRQLIASSATYANGLDKLIVSLMQNPVAISTSRDTPVLVGVKQFMLPVDNLTVPKSVENSTASIQEMWRKVSAVEYILSRTSFKQCILFSNSQFRANSFANYLIQNEWTVDLVIGSHDQNTRTNTLKKFRQYKSRILVTSDLMARGVDIVNVNLDINLDVPSDSSTYLHRIGRCGRFGRRGLAITLVSDDTDLDKFRMINGSKMKVTTFPTTLDASKKFDAWNTEEDSDSTDSYVFGKVEENVSTEETSKELSNGTECQKSSLANDSDSIVSENLNLLEIAKLLIDTKPNDQNLKVDIDDDLFANFQNSNTDTVQVQSELEVSENIFEEFAHIKNDTEGNDLEDLNSLLLRQQKDDETLSDENENHPEELNQQEINENATSQWEKSENESEIPKKTKQKEIYRKSPKTEPVNFSTSTTHWMNLYWQRINDINQYVFSSNCLYKQMPRQKNLNS